MNEMQETGTADMPLITGRTRVLVIVGDPIAQAQSPVYYNRKIAAQGSNAVLVPWHAPESHFETVMAGLMGAANVDGIVVTYPFKQRAMNYADRLTAAAMRVGAINALRREKDGTWTGGMFDGDGLIQAAHTRIPNVIGLRALLLGAGGAGSAIAYALAEAGVTELTIYDSDDAKGAALAKAVHAAFPDCDSTATAAAPAVANTDLLINATPVGLHPQDGLPIKLSGLSPSTTVIDIIARQEGTPLLSMAANTGCIHIGGAAMVEGQAEVVLNFLGVCSFK